jgi:hypothetical protein
MPQVLGPLVIAQLGIQATGLLATAISIAINLVVTFALTRLSMALFGGGSKPSDLQQTITEDIASRMRSYGVTHVGGVLTFVESRDGTLYMLIVNNQGQISEILEHRLNDKVVTLDGGGVVQEASFEGAIQIHTKLGTDDQVAYSQLTSVFPAFTSDHRQRGCSNVLTMYGSVKQKNFSKVYEGSKQPAYTQVRKGVMVYDPRLDSTQIIGYDEDDEPIMGSGSHDKNDSSTWEWSDNAALVITDYFHHSDGYGQGVGSVNWTNIAQEADIADEEVTTIDAEVIARYRLWGSYLLAEDDRKAILRAMADCCDAYYWQDADLKFNLHLGRWETPTVHITEDHIINLSAMKGARPGDQVNEVKIVYTDSRFGYRETESAPIIDLAAQDAQGIINQRFDRFWIPHHNQASRIGKLLLLRYGDRWHVSIMGNMYLLNLLGERFCYLTVNALNIVGLSFQVGKLKLNLQDNTVEIQLDQVMSTDWDFNAEVEEGTPQQVPGSTYEAPVIPVPTNLVLTQEDVTSGSFAAPTIRAEVDEPSREGLLTIFEFKKTVDSAWLRMVANDDEYTANSGIVSSGEEYQSRAKHYSLSGRESDWTATETITPSAPTLATPTQFTLDENAGVVTLSARASPQAAFDHIKFFRHTADVFGSASQVGSTLYGSPSQVLTLNDTPGTGTFYYWAVAYDAASTASAPTASETVTI